METKPEYIKRRIKEITAEIEIAESYISNINIPDHQEAGVGSSYLKRRNSRLTANQSQRCSEIQGRMEKLKKELVNIIGESSIMR